MAPKKQVMKKPAARAPPPPVKVKEEEEEEEDEEDDEGEEEEEEGDGEGEEEEEEQDADEVPAVPAAAAPPSVTSTAPEAPEPSPNRRRSAKTGLGAALGVAARGTPPTTTGSSVGSPASTAKRAVPDSEASPPPSLPRALAVEYASPASGCAAPLGQGLAVLRRAGKFVDAAVVHSSGRIRVHRAVLAAASGVLAKELDATPDIDLGSSVSAEAADCFVRWAYGEVDVSSYRPSTLEVNMGVLRVADKFQMERLKELCAAHLAAEATTANVVAAITCCEQYALPQLRAALVAAIVHDSASLMAVARDPSTLGHPKLMRELLAWVAVTADQAAKRQRV